MIEPGFTGGRLDGIGVYTRALLRYLPDADCEVQPWSWPEGQTPPSEGAALPQSFGRASLVDLLTPGAHRIHMPADVFHATDYRVVRMDCPVVATLHDALPIKHPEWCNPRLRGLKNWLQRKAAQKADHVIAVSQYAVEELVDCFGVDERRISVVPNGVDEEWLEAPAPAYTWRKSAWSVRRFSHRTPAPSWLAAAMRRSSSSERAPALPTMTSWRSSRTACGSASQASSRRSTFLRGWRVPTNRK